jgi:hypothetical protein
METKKRHVDRDYEPHWNRVGRGSDGPSPNGPAAEHIHHHRHERPDNITPETARFLLGDLGSGLGGIAHRALVGFRGENGLPPGPAQLNFPTFSARNSRFSPFRDGREDVLNGREELRHPRTDVRQPTTDVQQPTTDLRQPTTDLRRPRTEHRGSADARPAGRTGLRQALPERPKRPKTAFGTPKNGRF